MNADLAELVGIIVQSILYGMYLVSSGIAAYSIHHIRARKIAPNRVVTSVSTALFIFITLFYVLSVVRAANGFTRFEGNSARLLNFLQVDAIQATRAMAYYLVITLMDALLTYRLYVIYLRDIRIVILPVITTIAFITTTTVQIVLCIKKENLANTSDIAQWPNINRAISVFSCAYSTFFIIFRIVKDGFTLQRFGRRNIFAPVLYIVIESALVNCIFIFTGLGLYLTRQYDALSLTIHILPPLIGLNYSVILIHIGLGITNISQLALTLPTIKQSSFSNETAVANKSRHSVVLLAIDSPDEGRALKRQDIEELSGELPHQNASTTKFPTV